MADPPQYRDTDDDTEAGPDDEWTAGVPRWVKVFGAIALVVVVLFVILLVSGRGGHGPGRHTGSPGSGGHTPPLGVTHTASNSHDDDARSS